MTSPPVDFASLSAEAWVQYMFRDLEEDPTAGVDFSRGPSKTFSCAPSDDDFMINDQRT